MPALTPAQFGTILGAVAAQMPQVHYYIIEYSCIMFEDSAKNAIGNDDYVFGWPRLAQSTIQRKGFERPLYETGQLQRSIEHNADADEGYVGTNDRVAVWQEYGTSRIPARPFMGGALVHEEHRIPEIVHAALARVFP